jgi:hypothetical protein
MGDREMNRALTADDFIDEAESAERAGAWPQAAALWKRALETCREEQEPCCREGQQRCEFEIQTDAELTSIAKRVLGIPTLETRGSDRLDFHEVGVQQVLAALRLAHQLGRRAVVR